MKAELDACWATGRLMTQGQSIIYSPGTGAARDSQFSPPGFSAHMSQPLSEAAPANTPPTPPAPQPQRMALPGSWPLLVHSSQAPGGCQRRTGSRLGHVLVGIGSFYISCWPRCRVVATLGPQLTCKWPVCAHADAAEGSEGKVMEE